MKRQRKLRTRLLPLDFATPPNPVSHDRGRALLAKVRESLENSVDSERELPIINDR